MIRKIYSDPANPGGLSSIDKLYQAVREKKPNITRAKIKDALLKENAYTLHYPARRKWNRNKIIVSGPHVQGQADLCDMISLANDNAGNKYILTFVDAFSRFALAKPVKSKSQGDISAALESILNVYPVEKLQTDRGNEFKNKTVKDMCARRGTFLFFTVNQDIKCSIVERFNRTLKSRMFKYFTNAGTRNWVDVLPKLLKAYNESINRSINCAPAAVTEQNSEEIFKRLYDDVPDELTLFNEMMMKPVERGKFKIGDTVRWRYYLSPLEHRYYPNYSDIYYKIAGISRGYPHEKYILHMPEDNSRLPGTYYAEELQKVVRNEFRVEVKDERIVGRRKEILVHYTGYPSKYDEWVPATRARRLGG